MEVFTKILKTAPSLPPPYSGGVWRPNLCGQKICGHLDFAYSRNSNLLDSGMLWTSPHGADLPCWKPPWKCLLRPWPCTTYWVWYASALAWWLVGCISGDASTVLHSGVWRRGEIGKGWDCNTWPRRPHSKHVWNIPLHNLLQINYCTGNSRNNAIVLGPLRAIASHELLHELLRQQATIAATPLAESTPSPNSQFIGWVSS